MANAAPHLVTEAVILSIKIQIFSWKVRFLVLEDCPVPCILGADFLMTAKMRLDFATRRYSFGFKPETEFEFAWLDVTKRAPQEFPCPREESSHLMCESVKEVAEDSGTLNNLMQDFPALFLEELGTVKGLVCHLDLVDNTPVRSRPYQCPPPKLQALREIVQDLLRKGIIRKSYSQYASPAFLVPKHDGGHRMVVDYRLLNRKIVFDAFPMPTVESAFAHFANAKIFSVLDLNSAYYQIPLSAKSRKATAFCTPFGFFEFNKMPMGLSIGCQTLSRVVDTLFGDIKGKFLYNFMDDLVVYSTSFSEHLTHLQEVLARLEKAGFTLNRDKIHLAQREISFLGHSLSAEGIRVLPERVEAINNFPPPRNLKAVRRFLGMAGF
jgi:hypothetical protein